MALLAGANSPRVGSLTQVQQLEGCARTFGAEENRINRLIKQLPDDLPSLTAWLHEQHETFQSEQVSALLSAQPLSPNPFTPIHNSSILNLKPYIVNPEPIPYTPDHAPLTILPHPCVPYP